MGKNARENSYFFHPIASCQSLYFLSSREYGRCLHLVREPHSSASSRRAERNVLSELAKNDPTRKDDLLDRFLNWMVSWSRAKITKTGSAERQKVSV